MVISRWKSEFAANMSAVFKKSNPNEALEENIDIEKLHAQIGQLKVENDFLKNLQEAGNMNSRYHMVKPETRLLSIRKQCDLLSVSRNRLYYKPVAEKPENIKMMQIMDKHLLYHPTEGVCSMVYYLRELVLWSIPSGFVGSLR